MFNRYVNRVVLTAVTALAAMGVKAEPLIVLPRPAPPLEQTVNDLLLLDASRALENERKKAPYFRPSQSIAAPVYESRQDDSLVAENTNGLPPPSPVQLAAIYGVGRALHAEVRINGSLVVFAKGNANAIRGEAKGWSLRNIESPCVELIEPTGDSIQLCSYRPLDKGKES